MPSFYKTPENRGFLSHQAEITGKTYEVLTTFMQNKPNFQDVQMNVTTILTKDYEKNDIFAVPENKANSNPIQSQFKPNFKPNHTQSNPISNPVGRVGFSPPILFSNFFLAFTFLCPIYNLAMQNWTIQKLLNWVTRSQIINNLDRSFRLLRCKAGVDECVIHDLRRSAITNWAKNLPIQVVQQLAGHEDIATTRKYYLAVRPEDLASANSFLNKVLAGVRAN